MMCFKTLNVMDLIPLPYFFNYKVPHGTLHFMIVYRVLSRLVGDVVLQADDGRKDKFKSKMTIVL